MKNLLLVGMLSLTLFGCSTDSGTAESVDTSSQASEKMEADDIEKVDSSEETLEEEVVLGKRTTPAPIGEWVEVEESYSNEDWTETYEAKLKMRMTEVVRGEEAKDILANENMFNEDAPEGMEWVIATLEAELLEGDEDVAYTLVPFMNVVDSSGSEVSQDAYGTLEGSEFGFVDLFPGGTTSGRTVFYVPTEDESLLVYNNFTSKIYFDLK